MDLLHDFLGYTLGEQSARGSRSLSKWMEAGIGCTPKTQDLVQGSHLHMGSLGGNDIGDAGARDMGAALQVNTTLTSLW